MASPCRPPLSPPGTNSSASSFDSSDSFDPYDYLGVGSRFGYSPFVKAIRWSNLESVQELLSQGSVFDATDIIVAAFCGEERILATFLDLGASPDIRSAGASPAHDDVKPGWGDHDRPVWFDLASTALEKEWYPLMAASHFDGPKTLNANTLETMRLLIGRGADPYAELRFEITHPEWYPYPGQDFGPDDPRGQFDTTTLEQYGVRTVVHSLIEDGGAVLAFFDTPGFSLDLERRDPQGRTVLHSICRCRPGADTAVGATGLHKEQHSLAAPEERQSLFHTARLRGADMLAVDRNDKNVLHHLLEAQASMSTVMPMMKDALTLTLAHHPELLHKPDRFGNYPLHSSLQRLRHYDAVNEYIELAGLESIVHQLLDAGADPFIRDSRGNTALHYLADYGLTDASNGEQVRQLFRRFIELGLDIHARNGTGTTALRMVLKEGGSFASMRRRQTKGPKRMSRNEDDVDREVFALFDQAGVEWTERDGQGRTLLHVVHKSTEPKRAAFRAKYLVQKGVDPKIKDSEGTSLHDWFASLEHSDPSAMTSAFAKQAL